MDDFDYSIDITEPTNNRAFAIHDEVPEPIDQWAVEDFEQFASLIVEAE